MVVRALFLLAAIAVPSLAYADNRPCPPGVSPNALCNQPAAVDLQSTDLVYVYQFGQTPGTRAATVGEITGGGATDYVPVTGGTFTGDVTFAGDTTAMTGTLTVGQGLANYLLLSGSSGSPSISVLGSGNQFATLQGLGQYGGLLRSSNGTTLWTQDAGNGTTGNYLKVIADITGSPVQLSASDNTGGLRVLSPTQLVYNWTYSGTQGSNSNRSLLLSSSIGGASNNTSAYSVNSLGLNYTLQTAWQMSGLSVSEAQQAGFFGRGNAFLASMSQTGAPTLPGSWATSTSYAPTAPIIYNGVNEYQLNSGACTSSSSPGGPTGTGTSISDGTCNWRFVSNKAQSYSYTSLISQASVAFNVGGIAAAPVGFVFGGSSSATASSAATYLSRLVGFKSDVTNSLGSGNPYQMASQKLVKTGNGGPQDWGLSVAGGAYNAVILQSAVMPNGVGLSFTNQSVGGLQTMAGAFDCILCSTTGTNTTSGIFVTGGGGYILRGPGAQLLGTGDLQLGSAGFHISSQALTLDTTYEVLASVGSLSGGTLWTTSMLAVDDYGNVGTVTASAGVPTGLSLTCGSNPCPKTYVAAGSIPGGSVTWHAMNANGNILDAAGGSTTPTNFTTASETYTVGTTLNFGTSSATAINIGNSGSTLTLSGLVNYGGTAPTVSSCGTSPAVVSGSNSTKWTVTVGTSAGTSCTVSLGYLTSGRCRVTSQQAVAGFNYSYGLAGSVFQVVVGGASDISGDTFDADCNGA